MKIRPVGDELIHADGRTDMTKLSVAFRNFRKLRTRLKRMSSTGMQCDRHETSNSCERLARFVAAANVTNKVLCSRFIVETDVRQGLYSHKQQMSFVGPEDGTLRLYMLRQPKSE